MGRAVRFGRGVIRRGISGILTMCFILRVTGECMSLMRRRRLLMMLVGWWAMALLSGLDAVVYIDIRCFGFQSEV